MVSEADWPLKLGGPTAEKVASCEDEQIDSSMNQGKVQSDEDDLNRHDPTPSGYQVESLENPRRRFRGMLPVLFGILPR